MRDKLREYEKQPCGLEPIAPSTLENGKVVHHDPRNRSLTAKIGVTTADEQPPMLPNPLR
jgi:hypothetical protein